MYEGICKKIETIIEEVLNNKKINYYSVTSRAKSIDSYKFKASKPKYKNPQLRNKGHGRSQGNNLHRIRCKDGF